METHAHTLREIAEQSHPGETREALLSAATVIDRQAARIRELEGALAEFVATDDEMPVIPWSNDSQAKWFDRLYAASRNARRILEGGKS